MISHAVEDYLKAIYELADEGGKVTTSALSEKLNVTPASVSGMRAQWAGGPVAAEVRLLAAYAAALLAASVVLYDHLWED